jgi:hypothetical protein
VEKLTVAYRGFDIQVTASIDHDDLWDFEYQIVKAGDAGSRAMSQVAARKRTMGQYATEAGARDAGVDVARIEIDNLVALTQK